MSRTAAVCGATGRQGRAVIDALLRRGGWRIRGLTRDPDQPVARDLAALGVELVRVDLADRRGLEVAFAGASAVFGVTQPWSADRRRVDADAGTKQGEAVIDACLAAGVGHLVLSTMLRVDARFTGIAHVDGKYDLEDYAEVAGVPCTAIGPGLFFEELGGAHFAIREGRVHGLTDASTHLPWVSCRDLGEAAARVLGERDRWLRQRLNLVADIASGADVCEALSRAHPGRSFTWRASSKLRLRLFAPDLLQWRDFLERHGQPPFPMEYTDALAATRLLLPDALRLDGFLGERSPAGTDPR